MFCGTNFEYGFWTFSLFELEKYIIGVYVKLEAQTEIENDSWVLKLDLTQCLNFTFRWRLLTFNSLKLINKNEIQKCKFSFKKLTECYQCSEKNSFCSHSNYEETFISNNFFIDKIYMWVIYASGSSVREGIRSRGGFYGCPAPKIVSASVWHWCSPKQKPGGITIPPSKRLTSYAVVWLDFTSQMSSGCNFCKILNEKECSWFMRLFLVLFCRLHVLSSTAICI